ncbi:SCO2521 family protein [Streptomyces sp. HUAS ZL42]|uniref:SCO2521 family protein n=1 Tax=Streptomyces sp. HUAS ZL42 TaxID=3231715 RepID=UPI00345EC510
MSAPGETTRPVLACGEVRTCLLPTRDAVSERDAESLLRLRADEPVRLSRRPNPYALSPDVLTGVDCRLPTANRAKVRAVGTVAARASLTEGRILQATAYFRAPGAGPDRRQPWGYYLVRPGVLVPVGRLDEQAVAQGFLAEPRQGMQEIVPDELDAGSVAEGLLARISRHRLLDHDAPITSPTTSLRWAALTAPDAERPVLERFTVAESGLRLVRLRLPDGIPAGAVARLCEDLALHDWLLTTVVHMLDNSRLGAADGPSAVLALRPAVDHLLHLWMPHAHVDDSLVHLWEELERRPGFTRQWQSMVQRIRDQLALQAIPLLHEALFPR